MINLFYAPHALLACVTHHAGGSGRSLYGGACRLRQERASNWLRIMRNQESPMSIAPASFQRRLYGSDRLLVGTQEPMVRRLFPGGNRIRTIGSAGEETEFAADSPLERMRFEPLVPPRNRMVC